MPQSSGAWVRMPSWIELAVSIDALACGAADEGAVVDAALLVGPGVLMRIELDKGQRTVHSRMGSSAAAA